MMPPYPIPSYLSKVWESRTEEEGDCLIWRGVYANRTTPAVFVSKLSNPKYVTVRRVLLEAQRGKPLPANLFATTSCGNSRCVAPAHVRPGTVSGIARAAVARGAWDNPLRAEKIARAKQAQSPLTWEDVERIRAAKSAAIAAKETGGKVSKSTCTLIRAGKRWRVKPADPWAAAMWRLAA